MSITNARVTNRNEFPIDDRYDGIPYLFAPNKPVVIPLDAAAAIFGMPVDSDGVVDFAPDPAYMARRWGWNVLEKREEKELTSVAMERLTRETAAKIANISVEAVSHALREVRVEEGLPPPRTGAVEIPNSDTPESEVQRGTMDDEPGDGDEFIEETAPTNDKERMVDRLLGRNKSKKIAAG